MAGWLVAVEGPSASGKSRAVREAARSLGVPALPEAYDRVRPRLSLSWTSDAQLLRLERRLLHEEAARFREGRRLARDGTTVIADTGFLGPITYSAGLVRRGLAPSTVLAELVTTARTWAREGRWGLPDAVLYLRTPERVRQRRAARDPWGHPASLQGRHQAVAAEELRLYRTVVAPAMGPRFRFVSGNGLPGEVVGRLARTVERTRTPARRPSLDRILRAIGSEATVP
jgi:thymidylate kinase